MSAAAIYGLLAAALLGVGMHALFARANLVRKIMALNIVASAVFLLLIAIAARGDPVRPDPVPHAMVLTGIVVAVSATALALALARRIQARTGRCRLTEEKGLE